MSLPIGNRLLPVEQWSTEWADEIMPLAREAHQKLQFNNVHIAHNEAEGTAVADGQTYPDFCGKVTADEIHKAGWRLAALLEEVVPQQ